MQFAAKTANPVTSRHQCIVAGVFDNKTLSNTAKLIDDASDGHLSKVLKQGDITGKTGQTLMLQQVPGIKSPRVLLVGLGNKDSLTANKFANVVVAMATVLKSSSCTNVLCCLLDAQANDDDVYWASRRIVETFEHTSYRYTEMKGNPAENSASLATIDILITDKGDAKEIRRGVSDGIGIASGVKVARDVGNTPGNICNPAYLASEARKLARGNPKMTTTVLEEKDMKRLGMGALLSVSQGSAQPAKLVTMQYTGTRKSAKPHVLVGKGITFDSGGISIKPAGTMYEMIWDMCGAASVLGTMAAVAALKLPINVVGVLTCAENMPSGTASRPGDIVKSMSGQTIEILNTDAEGRLVLSDALTYIEKFNPETVVDIATLTGAVIVALGSHASGLYANDEDVAERLLAAGTKTGDRAWRMPLWEDYQAQINSAFADMANTGGRDAGSITAACFLARFTKKYRWAHLDIAGTSFKSGGQKSSTGRPVPLLTQYLMNHLEK